MFLLFIFTKIKKIAMMRFIKLSGLVLASVSLFNVCSAQGILNGEAEGKNIRMTLDPFAVNAAILQGFDSIQQNTADINTLETPSFAEAIFLGQEEMLEGLSLSVLSEMRGDTVHFFVDSLSSFIPGGPNNAVVGVGPGLYNVQLTAVISLTSGPSVSDTTYTGLLGIALGSDLPGSDSDEEPNVGQNPLAMLDIMRRSTEFSLLPDSIVTLSLTTMLLFEDSGAMAPVMFDQEALSPPPLPGPNDGPPTPSVVNDQESADEETAEFEIMLSSLFIIRLGDAQESDIIFQNGPE